MKPLIPKTCGAIIYDKNCELSDRTIAKQLEYDKMAIYNVHKRLHETGSSIPKKKELATHLFSVLYTDIVRVKLSGHGHPEHCPGFASRNLSYNNLYNGHVPGYLG